MRPHPARFDVIACGLNVVDNIVILPAEVKRGEKQPVSHLLVQGGGPGANQACGLAALGWRTAIVTALGENTVSRIAEAEFARCGVCLDLALRVPNARPALAVVQVHPENGDRTVFYNLDHYGWLAASDVPAEAVRSARLVISDAYEFEAARRLLELAAEQSIPSVIDIETGEPERLQTLLGLASHAILSLEGGRRMTGCAEPGEILGELSTRTDAQLVVTDGARGCWALARGELLHQPAFRVDVVDTTGCGDSFHAAYAAGLLAGLALPERLEFASWLAAQVALALGSRSNLPSRHWLRDASRRELTARLRAALPRIIAE